MVTQNSVASSIVSTFPRMSQKFDNIFHIFIPQFVRIVVYDEILSIKYQLIQMIVKSTYVETPIFLTSSEGKMT